MDSLIQNFPEGTRPTPIEILTARGDQRKPVQQTISKTDLELKVATISCEYLEELYLQSTLRQCKLCSKQSKQMKMCDNHEMTREIWPIIFKKVDSRQSGPKIVIRN